MKYKKSILLLALVNIFIFSTSIVAINIINDNKTLESQRKLVLNKYVDYRLALNQLEGSNQLFESNKYLFHDIMASRSTDELNAIDNKISLIRNDVKNVANYNKTLTNDLDLYLSEPNKYNLGLTIDLNNINTHGWSKDWWADYRRR